jgi:hypothetical protein
MKELGIETDVEFPSPGSPDRTFRAMRVDDPIGRIRREFLERAVVAIYTTTSAEYAHQAEGACEEAEGLLREMQRRGWMP